MHRSSDINDIAYERYSRAFRFRARGVAQRQCACRRLRGPLGALDSVRQADRFTVYLDAGDLMTGNPICNKVVDGVEGGALLNMLRLCGCEAGCPGNHEFDLGADHIRRIPVHRANRLCLC
ncbi:MAG: hypothetical protein IPG71_07155 [bacterium]|nr:hypothetical protein [bacterium]